MKLKYKQISQHFTLLDNPRGVVGAAATLNHRVVWGREDDGTITDDDVWIRVIERATGTPGRLVPRGLSYLWTWEVFEEALARRVMAARIPWTVPLLHVGPGIVHGEPPPLAPRPTLSVAAAAECALMACEVVVRTYALACRADRVGLYHGPRNLRMVEEDGRWRIAWLVPGVAALHHLDVLAVAPKLRKADWNRTDAARLIEFFFALAPAARTDERPQLRALVAWSDDGGRRAVPQLAARFLALLDDRGAWPERVAALSVIAAADPAEQDWDFIIAQGEAEQNRDKHVSLPLAAAYHQRACRSAACGDPATALRDVEHALRLDRFAAYRLTRATLLDRLGHRVAARSELEAAFAAPALRKPPLTREELKAQNRFDRELRDIDRLTPEEHARALALRGVFRLHDGDLDGAEDDLRRAFDLHPTAEGAHALGAARYALGDVAGAAAAESRSVELAPDEPRYRRDLAVSLIRLGRRQEARVHVEAALALAPTDAASRALLDRLAD